MKKIILVIMTGSLLLFTQQPADEIIALDEYVRTGTVLAIEGNRINFDEMWLEINQTRVKNQSTLTITDRSGQMLSFSNLHAPCRVELIYQEMNNTFVPLKITILEQYRYDDKGFICPVR
jgi:hypothetical protein